jgi:acyl carrier protein
MSTFPYDDVLCRLKRFVADMSELSIDVIDHTEDIFECGYVDSLSSVDLLNIIEREYRLRIAEDALAERLSTLSAIAEHITTLGAPAP